VNFLGIEASDTVFAASDLYSSLFTSALLERVTFKDCNLKRVYYRHARLLDTSFASSNDEEAYMEDARYS
jgi:uncharacterized protein YjbI with pentapeptide repeats